MGFIIAINLIELVETKKKTKNIQEDKKERLEERVWDGDSKFQYINKNTYSGGDPRRLNVLKTISTRWPGPAKNMYKHCRE